MVGRRISVVTMYHDVPVIRTSAVVDPRSTLYRRMLFVAEALTVKVLLPQLPLMAYKPQEELWLVCVRVSFQAAAMTFKRSTISKPAFFSLKFAKKTVAVSTSTT